MLLSGRQLARGSVMACRGGKCGRVALGRAQSGLSNSAKWKRRVTLKSGGLLISSSSAAAALRRAGQSSFFCLNFCNDSMSEEREEQEKLGKHQKLVNPDTGRLVMYHVHYMMYMYVHVCMHTYIHTCRYY